MGLGGPVGTIQWPINVWLYFLQFLMFFNVSDVFMLLSIPKNISGALERRGGGGPKGTT